ncbi:hypothetical protein [Halobacillus aidingensis]|uniref:Sporulation protein YpjB n=1 Tax=Halobacillus aidingensis TaxID=240303 RepID=A0A1H0NM31_HALAD|nr:hypothetical protein [Halobacillus aidingensis]SDO93729.1 hypothetical protein SAMN05421677_109118 [Halobacillus aidingensis]
MGRAVLLFICSLIFTLVPSGLLHSWSEGPSDWETFASQYRRLAADEKFDLAERLWNSKYAEMEQYVQTLPDHHKETWTHLDLYSSTDELEETKWEEGLLTFLEVTSSENPYPVIAEKLEHFSDRSVSSVPLEDIEEEWNMIRPVVMNYVDGAKMKEANQALHELSVIDSITGREKFSEKITELVKGKSQQDWNAFLSTAIFIGGAILVTLLYVGAINYRESSKNRHRMKSGHS